MNDGHLTPLRGLCAIPSCMSTYSCLSVLFAPYLVPAEYCSRFDFFLKLLEAGKFNV